MCFAVLGIQAEIMQVYNPLVIKSKTFSMVCNYTRNTRSLVPNQLLFKSSIFVIS